MIVGFLFEMLDFSKICDNRFTYPFHVNFAIDIADFFYPYSFLVIVRTWLVKYVDKTCRTFLSSLNLYP